MSHIPLNLTLHEIIKLFPNEQISNVRIVDLINQLDDNRIETEHENYNLTSRNETLSAQITHASQLINSILHDIKHETSLKSLKLKLVTQISESSFEY